MSARSTHAGIGPSPQGSELCWSSTAFSDQEIGKSPRQFVCSDFLASRHRRLLRNRSGHPFNPRTV